MNFKPKDFIIPSVIAHIFVGGLLIVLCWGIPTIKVPKKQQFRVNLVELSNPKQKKRISSVQRPTPKPKSVEKPKPKPKPKAKAKPKPKPKPKVKPKSVEKPKPKPKPIERKIIKKKPVPKAPKPTVKRPTTEPKRKILETPKKIVKKQEDWQKKRDQKKKIVKRPDTNNYSDVAWNKTLKKKRVMPKFKPLETTKYSNNTQSELDKLQKNVKEDRNRIRQRITSSFKNAKFSGVASAQQTSVINEYFQRSIRAAIDRSWLPPAGSLISSPEKAIVSFRLSKNGKVSSIRLTKRSSVSDLNSSAVQAIKDAGFEPFPSDLKRNFLDVEIPFECEPK